MGTLGNAPSSRDVRAEKLLSSGDYGRIGIFGRFRIAVCEAFGDFEAARRIAEEKLNMQGRVLDSRLVLQINSLRTGRGYTFADINSSPQSSGIVDEIPQQQQAENANPLLLTEGRFIYNPPSCKPGLYECKRVNDELVLTKCSMKFGDCVPNPVGFAQGVYRMESGGSLRPIESHTVIRNPLGVGSGMYLTTQGGGLEKLQVGDCIKGPDGTSETIYQVTNGPSGLELQRLWLPVLASQLTATPYGQRVTLTLLPPRAVFAKRFLCKTNGGLSMAPGALSPGFRNNPPRFIPFDSENALCDADMCAAYRMDGDNLVQLREGEVAVVKTVLFDGRTSLPGVCEMHGGKLIQVGPDAIVRNPVGRPEGFYLATNGGAFAKLDLKEGNCVIGARGLDAGGKRLDPEKAYRVTHGGELQEMQPNTIIRNPVGRPGIWHVNSRGKATQLNIDACVCIRKDDDLAKANSDLEPGTYQVNGRGELRRISGNETIFTPKILFSGIGGETDGKTMVIRPNAVIKLGASGLPEGITESTSPWQTLKDGEIFSLPNPSGGSFLQYQLRGNQKILLQADDCVIGARGFDAGGKQLDPEKAYRVTRGGRLQEMQPNTIIRNPVGRPGIWHVTGQGVIPVQDGGYVITYKGGGVEVRQVQRSTHGFELMPLKTNMVIFSRRLHIIREDSAAPAGSGRATIAGQQQPNEETLENVVLQIKANGTPSCRRLERSERVVELVHYGMNQWYVTTYFDANGVLRQAPGGNSLRPGLYQYQPGRKSWELKSM
jgi:hypothetical protein